MRRIATFVLAALCLLAVTAQAAGLSRAQRTKLTQYQEAYTAAVRWNDFDAALELVDPAQRLAEGVTELTLERYRQLQVSGYRERASRVLEDGSIERRMEIAVINRNTQAQRMLTVREQWRWDAGAKRWWQAAGLPDLWQGQ